jgi:hypothetical protein
MFYKVTIKLLFTVYEVIYKNINSNIFYSRGI